MTTSTLETTRPATPARPRTSCSCPRAREPRSRRLILEARVEGIPVTALCGHTWIPQRDPKPLPVCTRCLEIYQQPGDHRDELPDA